MWVCRYKLSKSEGVFEVDLGEILGDDDDITEPPKKYHHAAGHSRKAIGQKIEELGVDGNYVTQMLFFNKGDESKG